MSSPQLIIFTGLAVFLLLALVAAFCGMRMRSPRMQPAPPKQDLESILDDILETEKTKQIQSEAEAEELCRAIGITAKKIIPDNWHELTIKDFYDLSIPSGKYLLVHINDDKLSLTARERRNFQRMMGLTKNVIMAHLKSKFPRSEMFSGKHLAFRYSSTTPLVQKPTDYSEN